MCQRSGTLRMAQGLGTFLESDCETTNKGGSSCFIVASASEMVRFGACLSQRLLQPQVVAFCGDLGAGKTTIAKGVIAALTGISPEAVVSPTFQYVQFYQRQNLPIAHFDLWRLRGVQEFLDLGLEEWLFHTLAIVEWPERIDELLPKNTLWVTITCLDRGRRVVVCPSIPSLYTKGNEECRS